MNSRLSNVYRLGIKELRSLWADKVLLILITWAFTGAIYAVTKGVSQELHNAPVAIVDLDRSQLSMRMTDALTPPFFKTPERISLAEMDPALDRGKYSFGIVIPENFQRDLQAGRQPAIQLNIDATNMSQSFIGAGYIQSIFSAEINEYATGTQKTADPPIRLVTHARFNPNLTGSWFGGVMETINNITMLSIILVGAAFIREREHGTLEHLLAMPLSPLDLMLAKIWANGLAVLIGATVALTVVVQGLQRVPIAGSVTLFLFGAMVYLFSAASIGIFLGTIARSMPQLGLLIILTIVPLQLLSGGVTPLESMPIQVQQIMKAAPTTYFVRLAQAILYRGAGISIVWPELLAIAGIGSVFFFVAMVRFRRAVIQTHI